MQPSEKKSNKVITGIISVIALVAAIFGISKYKDGAISPQEVSLNNPTSSSSISTSTSDASTSSSYKDGSYSSEGSYSTPGGKEKIGVSLTISNNIVTSANVTSEAISPISKRFQGMFIGGYTQYVVGKNIANLKLTKVSGSSLTPKGFNDAIAKIEAEAKA